MEGQMNWYLVSWKHSWEDEWQEELVFGAEDTIRTDLAKLKEVPDKSIVLSKIIKYDVGGGSC